MRKVKHVREKRQNLFGIDVVYSVGIALQKWSQEFILRESERKRGTLKKRIKMRKRRKMPGSTEKHKK